MATNPTGTDSCKLDSTNLTVQTLDANGNFSFTDVWPNDTTLHTLNSHYSGDPLHHACDAAPLARNGVDPVVNTTQTISISPDPPIKGQPYTITGQVINA